MELNNKKWKREKRRTGERRRLGGGRPPFVERRKGERRKDWSGMVPEEKRDLLREKRVAFIGCGNMGSVLISGTLSSGLISKDKVLVTDIRPERLEYIREREGISITEKNREAVEKSDVIVLAVKPQVIGKVLSEIRDVVTWDKVIISIAAGITTGFIEEALGKEVPVVRVMPNTPCLVKTGASGISPGKYAGEEEETIAEEMFRGVGIVVKVPEQMLDAVTALSGSGPAYIFYIIESLIEAGMEMGLSEDDARKLVSQTVLGAARMFVETGESPQVLRAKVTSPGGTTEAALKYLEEKGFQKILIAAVKEAAKRSKELSTG
ncbi:pyrroline-5-carboxylate reductase [bacterium]|nr:pyrroline-5-carboxylate reductase [bacterium]